MGNAMKTAGRKIVAFLRGPIFRTGFMILAVAAAIWAVVANWEEVVAAASQLTPITLVSAFLMAVLYVPATMLSWRAVINDIGEPVPPRVARRIFFSSQVAKYLPGGVWNFVAAAEIGRDYKISGRRSFFALLISMAISVGTGLVFALLAVIYGPADIMREHIWVPYLLPIALICLTPWVLNHLVNIALRILGREPLERPLSASGTLHAAGWACASWLIIGLQLWLMLIELGMATSMETYILLVGGYALGWIAGFLVFFVPAGIGVREVALAAVLSTAVGYGEIVVVVLLSRVFTTCADLLLGITASVLMRKDKHAPLTPGQTGKPIPSRKRRSR
ncbi:lysylphosphatidylglycerol synthase transmembrane domain-containing protein [Actinobaculum suis]|uniref:lysylphosphatidylglycerol synthase transmembrane domain-containing protein n=1 Tax=Actinobaculum suis TaxID=1657 RepID=UPI000AE51DDB|nr:lysylphosphatidylglycerol synthase transmembrane domain-containing protein [Actinobaculum suis]